MIRSLGTFSLKARNRLAELAGKYERSSYAQLGEDLIVSFLLESLGVATPVYLDIGAHHPWKFNNTALFYRRGARGVNIDANPALIKAFDTDRPHDINLALGVAATAGRQTLHVMAEPTLSTFSTEEAQRYEREHGIRIVERVPIDVLPASEVIAKHLNGRVPEFVSVDVEGLEEEVLRSLDLARNRPLALCVETIRFATSGIAKHRDDLDALLGEAGYFAFADTHINTVYVDEKLWLARK